MDHPDKPGDDVVGKAIIIVPDFALEDSIEGRVCGIDEVGRGPLAGPVVTACVYVPDEARVLPFISDIRDSKGLSKKVLARLYDEITQTCYWGIGACSPAEIDQLNILWATMEAMKRAYNAMNDSNGSIVADYVLIDGNRVPPEMPCPARASVKGDQVSVSIAAASIVAKVTRDRIMAKLAEEHPHYGWESNAAYPSKQHLEALQAHGVTPHHRKSFGPVKKIIGI